MIEKKYVYVFIVIVVIIIYIWYINKNKEKYIPRGMLDAQGNLKLNLTDNKLLTLSNNGDIIPSENIAYNDNKLNIQGDVLINNSAFCGSLKTGMVDSKRLYSKDILTTEISLNSTENPEKANATEISGLLLSNYIVSRRPIIIDGPNNIFTYYESQTDGMLGLTTGLVKFNNIITRNDGTGLGKLIGENLLPAYSFEDSSFVSNEIINIRFNAIKKGSITFLKNNNQVIYSKVFTDGEPVYHTTFEQFRKGDVISVRIDEGSIDTIKISFYCMGIMFSSKPSDEFIRQLQNSKISGISIEPSPNTETTVQRSRPTTQVVGRVQPPQPTIQKTVGGIGLPSPNTEKLIESDTVEKVLSPPPPPSSNLFIDRTSYEINRA